MTSKPKGKRPGKRLGSELDQPGTEIAYLSLKSAVIPSYDR